MKEDILRIALENAVKYGGKCDAGSIIGRLLGKNPKLKEKIKDVAKDVNKIVHEVNKLSLDEQKNRLLLIDPHALDEKEVIKEKKTLPELKNVGKNPVFRFEPSPSGRLHLGHIYVLLLNSEYTKRYNGKLILRIADTNAEKIEPEAYKTHVEDAKWLTGMEPDVQVQSDRMEIYYNYAEKLLKAGHAYVCRCSSEDFKKLIDNKEACQCRDNSIKVNLKEWEAMHRTYKEGDGVVRIKTDVKHPNPAVRDWPAFRVVLSEHARQGKKYRVWPLMNFSVAIDDIEMGLTHVIRGKDQIVNMDRQAYIFNYLKIKIPEYVHVGRINFDGVELSKTKTAEAIKAGKYSGWDDPRLPLVRVFRRRGIKPEAFVKYVTGVGPSKVDKVVNYEEFMKEIYTYNREIIDKEANRYFFIINPKTMKIKNAPKMEIKASIYPGREDAKSMTRKFITNDEFLVDDNVDDKTYRFMHLLNFKNKTFLSKEHDPNLKAKLIDWLPNSKDLVDVEVLMNDGNILKGKGESNLKQLKTGDMVQFERKFFARLDSKEGNKMTFYFTHK